MAFRDYSATPSINTTIGDDIYIGPNMPRDNVRPALQQIAADGRGLYDTLVQYLNVTASPSAFYSTKAEATAALSSIAANAYITVLQDESLGGARTIYQKVSGALVLRANLSLDLLTAGRLPVSLFVTGTDEEDHSENHQPGIQAAVDYAEANGFTGIIFDKPHYSLWTPLFVDSGQDASTIPGAASGLASANYTGIPIVIRKRLEFVAAPGGTTLCRRTNDGSDPAVFANTQSGIGDAYGHNYWRGGLICMVGTATEPTTDAEFDALTALVFRGDWRLKGGIPRSATPGAFTSGGKSRLRADGTGWDVTDKAIYPTGNSWVGNIEVYGQLEIDGFRGEFLWRGGVQGGSIIVRGKLACSNCDGSVLDPNMIREGDNLDIDELVIHTVYQAMERYAGYKARIGYLSIYNCSIGGNIGGASYNDALDAGILQIDFMRIGKPESGSFSLSRNARCTRAFMIDCGLQIGTSQLDAWNVQIGTLEAWADKQDIGDALIVMVQASNAAGSKVTRAINVGNLICSRSPYAIANSKAVTNPVSYDGSYGEDIRINKVSGYARNQPNPRGLVGGISTVPDYHPGFGDLEELQIANYFAVFQNIESESTIVYKGPVIALSTTTVGGHFTATMPNMAGKLPSGSVLWLNNESSGVAGFISLATTNTALGRRLILPWRRWVKFRLSADGFWYLQGDRRVITGSTTVSLLKSAAAIPAGDVSDEQTFTVTGARVGMSVKVTPTTAISGDALLIGRVTADNTVGIRAQNMNLGGTLTIGSATYNVELDWAS